jgi:Ca2+-binding RTX toxin-like protein
MLISTGGDGDDFIMGFDGNDVIKGGSGRDTLDGGKGNDTIYMTDGHDIDTFGGSGADRFIFDFGGGGDIIDFEPGVDTLDFTRLDINMGDLEFYDFGDNDNFVRIAFDDDHVVSLLGVDMDELLAEGFIQV